MAEQTGLDVLEVKEEDLEGLGPFFECSDCAEVMLYNRWRSKDYPPEAIRPIKTFDFTWSELVSTLRLTLRSTFGVHHAHVLSLRQVRHLCQYHPKGMQQENWYWRDQGTSVPRVGLVEVANEEEEESAEMVM
jgi:hypothetical protein